MNGLNIEKFDCEPKSSTFEIRELSRLSGAFDFLSAFEPAFEPFYGFSAFYTDFLDFVSPLSYFPFLDFASFGGLSATFYFDLLFEDFLSLISFIFKNIIL